MTEDQAELLQAARESLAAAVVERAARLLRVAEEEIGSPPAE